MKPIFAAAAVVVAISLCNLTEKLKPAASSDEKPVKVAEKVNPEADREAVKQELMRLEKILTDASFAGDVSVLARNIAEDYVGTAADGTTQTKNQLLQATKPDKLTKSWTITDAQLVSLSNDSAVLTYVQTQLLRDGRTFKARITDTFVKRDNRWLIQAEQQTIIK